MNKLHKEDLKEIKELLNKYNSLSLDTCTYTVSEGYKKIFKFNYDKDLTYNCRSTFQDLSCYIEDLNKNQIEKIKESEIYTLFLEYLKENNIISYFIIKNK